MDQTILMVAATTQILSTKGNAVFSYVDATRRLEKCKAVQ